MKKEKIEFHFPPLQCERPRIELKPKGEFIIDESEFFLIVALAIAGLVGLGFMIFLIWIQ